jgi:hypothetical protein
VKVRSRFLAITLTFFLALSTSTAISFSANAASKPSPKPSAKAKKEPVKKKTVKKPAKKPAKKKTVKKKTVKKKPKYKSLPTTPPKCLPKVPKNLDGVYISPPKGEEELICVAAGNDYLLSALQVCQKKVCQVIYVASSTECKWWEVQSIVIGKYADVLGNLRTLAKGSKARELRTIVLISKEPVEDYAEILNMTAFCRSDAIAGKIPSNTFTPNPALAPAPTRSPSGTAMATPAATPTPTAS